MHSIDYTSHSGTHPTLGAVDHVSFYPLGTASLSQAKDEALLFASSLSCVHSVPVYLYGAASDKGIRLKDIRKSLGYFSSSRSASSSTDSSLSLSPDMGPSLSLSPPHLGITCVGAVPFVMNFNMRFRESDERERVKQVTKYVRQDKVVEALTLSHSNSLEVTCNLLSPSLYSPEKVLERAKEKAKEVGVSIVSSYCTGPSEDELLAMLKESL